jgi:predicted dehydrogenase
MCNFAVPPMERIRVGFVGIGERGTTAVFRATGLPGVETAAMADLRRDQCDRAKAWLEEKGRPGAKRVYGGGEESWKAVCDDPGVDLVYIAAPAPLHPQMILYALRAGKHVLTEVPGAQTLDEAWEIVETCEKARRHCMMLENCCYGEMEMLAWNLAHKGLLGTLVHAEGGYIHNLVWRQLEDDFRNRANFGGGTVRRYGNTYPTHALGPICLYMDMNRGDRMESVVSMSSLAAANREFAAAKYAPGSWQRRTEWLTGDMNTSVIRTARGRTILMEYSTASPRPYSRINLVQGTKGCFCDYPPRLALADVPGGEAEWMDEAAFERARKEHMHPLWRTTGALAAKDGGHGGMDFIMDLRWVWCLRNGLPLDMDVYDLASWSAIVPCTAESDEKGGAPVEIPDFTRGGWKTAKPASIGDVDLAKMGFSDPHPRRI